MLLTMEDFMQFMQNNGQGQPVPPAQPQPQQPVPQPTQAPNGHGPQRITPQNFNMHDILTAIVGLGRAHEHTIQAQNRTAQLLEDLAHRAATNPAPAPAGPAGTVRFHEPRLFNGKASEVDAFLREIKTVTKLQSRALVTDADKIAYFSTYLQDGGPSAWYHALELRRPHLLADYDGFIEAFKEHFQDTDVVRSAMQRLERLKQTGSAADYAARFCEDIVHLNVTDETAIFMFRKGLKSEVKDLMTTVKPSTVFDDFMRQVIDFDNRYHEREVERRHESKTKSTSNANTSTSQTSAPAPRTTFTTSVPSHAPAPAAPPSANNGPVPMEVDATGHKHLTVAERQRRRNSGLCLYCSEGGHVVADCPTLKQKGKAKGKALASAGKA